MSDRANTAGFEEALRQLGAGAGRSALLLEPNPDNQSRLARLLTVRGCRVIGTSSLEAGATLMREFEVDLVLLAEELSLPDPAGVVANLVALQPDARIVIMTPPDEPISSIRPVRLAAVEYLSRPFGDAALSVLL